MTKTDILTPISQEQNHPNATKEIFTVPLIIYSYIQTHDEMHLKKTQASVTYLHRKSEKILIEVFRATSQNVQSSLVSTPLKPVGSKLHSAKTITKNTVKACFHLYVSKKCGITCKENLYISAAVLWHWNYIQFLLYTKAFYLTDLQGRMRSVNNV